MIYFLSNNFNICFYAQKNRLISKTILLSTHNISEPQHDICNDVICNCVTSKCSDQAAHTRRLNRAFASRLILLTEHHLKFLSSKAGCTGMSESTLVKMPHSWKSHVAAHF